MAETVMFAPALTSLFWLLTSYMYVGQLMRARRLEAKGQARERPSDLPPPVLVASKAPL
jgi:hypothetical protein